MNSFDAIPADIIRPDAGPHSTGRFADIGISQPRRSGFTLVELLVVIAIIALLIGLIMPALGATFDSARVALCLSNQRQIGIAITTYANDFDDYLPYGPESRPISVADFYVVDGMVTSQISLLDQGKPVGLGLLLEDYLSEQPQVLFCPGSDQGLNAEAELDRVGRTQALSGYFYRHGSNTIATLQQPQAIWPRHARINDLGDNRNGQPIRALTMDHNFVPNPPIPIFNVVERTNHDRRASQVLYVSGEVRSLSNGDDAFTAMPGGQIQAGPEMMLRAFEQADNR